MEPTAKRDAGNTAAIIPGRAGATQQRLPGVIVRTGHRKPVTEKYRRVTLMINPQADSELRRIAGERFLGNMSAAASWSIGLAAATLDGPLRGLQVPANPAEALTTAKGSKP